MHVNKWLSGTRTLIVIIAGTLFSGSISHHPLRAQSLTNDCVVTTASKWVKVMLYRETPDGQKGAPFWRQPQVLQQGETRNIPHGQAGSNNRLHYAYTYSYSGDIDGDFVFSCKDGAKVSIPQ